MSSSTPSGTIDVSLIAQVIGTDEKSEIDATLAEFASAVSESYALVRAAFDGNDPVSIADEAHGAKGEAETGGATALAAIYAGIEAAVKADDMAQIRILIDKACREVSAILKFIKERS